MPQGGRLMIDEVAERRFWAKVEKTEDCWIWTGARNPDGYGNVGIRKKFMKAHRVAWMITSGPIPEGMRVLHRCDNPSCVKPDHLFIGSQYDNVKDMERKNRAVKCRGSGHSLSQFTEAQVSSFRREWATGVTALSLCQKYGIPTSTMHYILHDGWKHII
jgi:hypothetical protein